jgi:CarD family transcriptional regulator
VADKSRQRSKKTNTGQGRQAKKTSTGASRRAKASSAERRTSQVSRHAGRGTPVAKTASRPKPAGDGATSGMSANKKTTQRQGFKTSEYIVYPAHGVGQILAIEEQEIAGAKLELFVINFVKDKMTLRVPTAKIASVGMRKLAEPTLVKKALETLKGRARIKRTMWSRRAQEYEAKINSGDIVAIAEVVRDLYRSEQQPEQSYSERQLYEAALDRLSREISAVQHVTETEAVKEIEGALAKGPRRGPAKATEAEAEADDAAVEDEAA